MSLTRITRFALEFSARSPIPFHDWARSLAEYLARAPASRHNFLIMRILLSLFLTAALALGTYYAFLKHGGAGGPGSLPTQAITTTGIQMDLTEIAQGERLYFAQAGSYGTMDQL